MISWHIVNSATYKAGLKIEEDLYFLSDTREIYRGSAPFTESVVMYTDSLPADAIALNRLYINSATLEGNIHNGSNWVKVIKPVVDNVTADGEDPVNSKAVIAYVAAQLASVAGSADVVSSLTWDSAEHILTAIKGDDSQETITFDGLGVSLSYVSNTGALQLLDANGEKIGDAILLPKEQFVTSGEYNAENKKIILYFDTEKTNKVEIDATGLVDIYTGDATSSASVSVSADNKITATVKISSEAGNTVVLKSDGIYVSAPDVSDKMDLVPDATEGHIATLDSNGQVVDSGKSFDDLASNNTVYQGESIEAATADATPVEGDFCIVSKTINGDKKELTAYRYNGVDWVAFDGNYNAENVFFDEDLITTYAVGNFSLNNGQATIPAAGKNLKQVFDSIYVTEKNPTITQPAVTLNAPNNKAYEVGSTVTPTYTATLSSGSYQYGPATGITATGWTVTDTDQHSATTNTGSFDAFTVEDDTNYTITATATYGDGAIPVTNVGNNYTSGQIKAGSKSKTSAAITGYRCGFYGTLTDKTGEINSALVRSLSGKTTSAPSNGTKWTLSIPVGATRLVFAYPATLRDVSSVTDTNGMGAEVKSAFTKYDVNVEGANGYTAAAYKVYVMDLASANDTANTYTITI